MAILAGQTIVGTVGQVYDLRTVKGDNKVLNASVAVTPRKKIDDQWVDGETYWVSVTFWGRLAENVSESWKKGDRVFVMGHTDVQPARTYKDDDGNERDIAAKPILVAEFAGHENSYHKTTQTRDNDNKTTYSDRSSSKSEERSSRSASKKPARKPEPEPVDEDLDLDIDLDDDDDELPF